MLMINTLDHLMYHRCVGVLYLDHTGGVLAKNDYADSFFEKDSEISCIGDKLVFKRSKDRDYFDLKLLEIQHGRAYASLFVKRNIDEPPIKLSLHPIVDSLASENMNKPVSVLLLKDTKQRSQLDIDSLADHFGLTEAESSLVESMYLGCSLRKHAEVRGVKITTVRWTLDNIFSKTYVHSQSELIELARKYTV